ncbi:MAG: prepilin-type N-terminal cleavage/methylation domain-containing protein [Elusimicrobiales bacterium]|nr:prepilin-type N-terminal cleavage/methylation domain-containing protein [Elusimicrobiales bacterium]
MRKGFTLIELLVVVLIMGILASVAMPQYFRAVEKSRASEAIDALSAIASAQERAYMQKGHYVGSLRDLDIGISNLQYFTVHYIFSTHEEGKILAMLQRNVAAGGGLGSYYIVLKYPVVPGTAENVWHCYPKPQCTSFLPK